MSKSAMTDSDQVQPVYGDCEVAGSKEGDESTNDLAETWTIEEERRVRWKLDLYLMPILVSGFFVLQLDRSNVSNALTDTIREDLGLSQSQVNAGASLMQAGIVVAELPANALLQRVGAPIWLTGQVFCFGIISIAQAWCTNSKGFLATRFILGLFEAGYIPGAQYILSLFYRESELAMRTAVFYFGNYFAAATGNLIAAGILQLAGKGELSGWQWLFIIEGGASLLIFFVHVALLPWSPDHTQPIHGRFNFFTDRERQVMRERLILDDPSKQNAKAQLTVHSYFRALVDYRLWTHFAFNMLSLAPKGGLGTYGPSIIKSLGFSKTNANLLNSVSSFMVIILSFAISYASDATHLRGPWCIIASIWSIAYAGAMFGLPVSAGKWTKYAVFTLLMSGNAMSQGLNDAWLNINARSATRRSVGLALAVMGSNLGGLAGAQLFQAQDAPRYTNAWLAIVMLYVGSIIMACIMMFVYWRDNKKLRKENQGVDLTVAQRLQL